MSYEESECQCDWCKKAVGGDVACRTCYEELEDKVAELERQIVDLEATIDANEHGL